MAFYDCFHWHHQRNKLKKRTSAHRIHAIANEAAEHFLWLLTEPTKGKRRPKVTASEWGKQFERAGREDQK